MPIVWRSEERVILVKLAILLNIWLPIVVNCEFGAKTIELKRVQPWNGEAPILVTVDGMETLVKFVQFSNA